MKTILEAYDMVVCGGGLAGFCAAVSAARHGAATCLVQDRAVFGGNSSSEVRISTHGAAAYHAYWRETGIVSELLITERAINHAMIAENGGTNSIWDLVLYDMAVHTPNLVFHLNTSVTSVTMSDDRKIRSASALINNAETILEISGKIFIDCTGDGVVAAMAGCEYRMGSEGQGEFNESHAFAEPSANTMGNSLHFKAEEMPYAVPFQAPDWAVVFDDPSFFYEKGRGFDSFASGYWWLEIGLPWDTIEDNETIRHELTHHLLGVWDWLKNKDPRTKAAMEKMALEWIGQVPGKRESRRIMGRYFMTEPDLVENRVFNDEVAYGGWYIDLHTPGGLLADFSERVCAEGDQTEYAGASYVGPYGIPLRALIARDVDNLMMAGRNISVSHVVLGTVRVQGTTALMGQAAGTAAALYLFHQVPLAEAPGKIIGEVQQALLRDGVFLPHVCNVDPSDLVRASRVTASSRAMLTGVGPDTPKRHQFAPNWYAADINPDPEANRLIRRRGQLIAVGSGDIDSLWVCLSNTSAQVEEVSVELVGVDSIWDYRLAGSYPIASAALAIPPGKYQWIEWPIHQKVERNGYIRLDLIKNSAIVWHPSPALEPGQVAQEELTSGKMQRLSSGVTLSFRITPPQECYGPENIKSGVTRPYRFTNVWRSDPAEPLPAWLELDWNEKQAISQVDITFAGNLLCEYHATPPLYRDPQCVSDYAIFAWGDGEWQELFRVTDNYQRLRSHVLPQSVWTEKLRIVFYATHGDPSAAVYEVRVYPPETARAPYPPQMASSACHG